MSKQLTLVKITTNYRFWIEIVGGEMGLKCKNTESEVFLPYSRCYIVDYDAKESKFFAVLMVISTTRHTSASIIIFI